MSNSKLAFLPFLFGLAAFGSSDWKPVPGRIQTKWASQVNPASPLPEYPRPQMVRPEWQNLNGLWDFAIVAKAEAAPVRYEGKILVPFAAESSLSGVGRAVTPEQRLWYRRQFRVPAEWRSGRVVLHFGAVDWHAVATVNGKPVGEHKGGYTPFSFDITGALRSGAGQELVVSVWDPTDTYTQPRGKQVRKPEGIWYTSVTGIWQTVWIEPVPESSVSHIVPVPDIDNQRLDLTVSVAGPTGGVTVRAEAFDKGKSVARADGKPGERVRLAIAAPKLWSPETPTLYDLRVSLWRGAARIDEVSSYFGMRKISLGKDRHGYTRILLNNKPYFQIGPLDQGWWPDGLYTAPTDEALRWDIEFTRDFGYNMARKHVKIEPARWYYHCDRLGLLVWQDMPSGNLHPNRPGSLRIQPNEPDAIRDAASSKQWEAELAEMIRHFGHFPSIVMWVPFNEGWGQYDTPRIARLAKSLDPSRLINATSGWTDRGVGDLFDSHTYPGPGMEPPETNRATVVGEYGGLGFVVPNHLWLLDKNWGYRSFEDKSTLEGEYLKLGHALKGMLGLGLSAAVYTQTADTEIEVNGLTTYDRAVTKFSPANLRALHADLARVSGKARILAADSSFSPQSWRYTTERPPEGWEKPEFDASPWKTGLGGFGADGGPRFRSGAEWKEPAIWLRREFTGEGTARNLFLTAFQGVTECEVYLNGRRIHAASNPRVEKRHYTHFDVSEHASALRKGRNVIAIRATKDKGPRAIDAGLYTLVDGELH